MSQTIREHVGSYLRAQESSETNRREHREGTKENKSYENTEDEKNKLSSRRKCEMHPLSHALRSSGFRTQQVRYGVICMRMCATVCSCAVCVRLCVCAVVCFCV